MNTFPEYPRFSELRRWMDEGGDLEEGLAALARKIRRDSMPGVWISLVPEHSVRERVRSLMKEAEGLSGEERKKRFPLYGIPFAVKDNFDVEGMETTAACPAYAYMPEESAPVVKRLLEAGAVLMGKTNMDQFATGLVGTRSPYGACPNAVNPEYISGGSSSGSAHAVAAGYVSFSLGTDTAGSGRVPAGLNNIVGLKPTRGRLSIRGIVPACPSLDCPSVFALTCSDAEEVCEAAQGYDEKDVHSRQAPRRCPGAGRNFTFGVPKTLEFCGNTAWESAYMDTVARMESLGGTPVLIDYEPYREAAEMLYFGPYLAERMAGVGGFVEANEAACDPTVRKIILGAGRWSAVDTFRTLYRTEEIKRIVAKDFAEIDVLLLPTAPTTYRIEEVRRDPVRTNVTMGTYTNFVNILDLCGVAVPAGTAAMPGTGDRLPFGVTLIAPAFCENKALSIAERLHDLVISEGNGLGAGLRSPNRSKGEMPIAVCGAHMSGLALNFQMEEAGAVLLKTCRTSSRYALKLVPGEGPLRPGLVRLPSGGGSVEVEVWSMPRCSVGAFLEKIPAPLGLGSVELEDGTWVKGFICESAMLNKARDITSFGSFRSFVRQGRGM